MDCRLHVEVVQKNSDTGHQVSHLTNPPTPTGPLKLTASIPSRSVQVKSDATDEYNVYSQEFLKRTVWSSGCRSWYKNGKVDGKVTAMYAGTILHYKENLEAFRSEDFELEYRSANRFKFMGNGFTIREEKGEDLSFYLKK